VSARLWIGPAGSEWLGDSADGTPVVGSDEGVGPMTEIEGIISVAIDWFGEEHQL
jgi:hypothetical protein